MYFATNALARIIEKLSIDTWKKVNLSPSHAYLLMLVVEEPGMQPGALAGQLRLTPSTITRLIEKLETRKLVVRTSEGKITNVYPTPKAKELYPQLINCVTEFTSKYYAILGKEECDKLTLTMANMADKLDP